MSIIRRSVAPRALAAALASTAVALSAGSAAAQNIQKFNPATGTTNFVTVEGAATAPT